MQWNDLLCEKRKGTVGKTAKTTDTRNEFQKDYHRIICSASFRRLQDKTQVFPLDSSDFIRTRLTHSIEVSSFAKSLGQSVCQYLMVHERDAEINAEIKEKICSVLECAGLIHDIGNPPFGHFGESSIRNWFQNHLDKIEFNGKKATDLLDVHMQNDLYHFEGNAQALRLLSKLHYLVDENGMHLTFALLNTLIKYPVSSCEINKTSNNIKDEKMGYYYAEKELFEEIYTSTGAVGCRHPLTYLLEAADDIAYKTADIEDALKKGYLSYYDLLKELKSDMYIEQCQSERECEKYQQVVGWLEEKYQRAHKAGIANPELNAVQNWVISVQGFLLNCATYGFTANYQVIMEGCFTSDLLSHSFGKVLSNALSNIAYQYVFRSKQILKIEISAGNILNFLLDRFVNAVIYYDTNQKLSPLEDRLIHIISENYKQIYNLYTQGKREAEKLYLRLLLVTDFICGMTDSYAKSLYQELNGIT